MSNDSPKGRLEGEIPNEATAPPPKVGYTFTVVSLPTVTVPFPYSIVAIGSLIVKLKLMFLVAPSLLTCKVNIDVVKLTVGVPHIVPLSVPNCNPSGSSGTICHEIILPLISEGTIGDIGAYSFDFAKTITTGEGGRHRVQTHPQQRVIAKKPPNERSVGPIRARAR